MRRRRSRRARAWAARLRDRADATTLRALGQDEALAAMARGIPTAASRRRIEVECPLVVDRERARYSAWYELFPRSCGAAPGAHGTFRDCAARLPYVAEMGFDVLYLPPIHPIGRKHRKGRNNTLEATPTMSAARGRSAPPRAGTPRSIRSSARSKSSADLVARARSTGWKSRSTSRSNARPITLGGGHPEWFRRRPDGTVQYAENPPKKYEDIYPFNFEIGGWTGAVAGARERVRVLDRPRRAHLSRRQPAHQAIRVLGVGDRTHQARAPGSDLPRPKRSPGRR